MGLINFKRKIMNNLSLNIEQDILEDTNEIINELGVPRNHYINKAIAFYNLLQKRQLLKKQLEKESALVSKTSMEILAEFEKFEE